MIASRRRDLCQLFAGGAVFVHVSMCNHGVIRNQSLSGKGLHIVTRADASASATGTNSHGVTVCGRTVSEQCYLSLAFANGPQRVGGMKFVRTAAHTRGVDYRRLNAKVFGNHEPTHRTTFTGVVDGIHIAPAQPSICQGLGSTRGLDLQGIYFSFYVS